MLIRFSIENFLSFKKKTTLEMFASKNQKPENQVVEFKKGENKSTYIPKILKSAFIFGPNASGKSNLILALDYARCIILEKPNRLENRVPYFKLCKDCHLKPSLFEFEFIQNRKIYKYGIKILNTDIIEEWLYQILSNKEDKIYHRKFDEVSKNQFEFGPKYEAWEDDLIKKSYWMGVPRNKTFLSDSISRNQDDFIEIQNWFKRLIVIYPESSFISFDILIENKSLIDLYSKILNASDIGIDSLEVESLNADDVISKLPKAFVNSIDFKEDFTVPFAVDSRYIILKNKEKRSAYKIVIKHKVPSSDDCVEFNISEESDGSNRLFDLIPLMDMIKYDKIIIVDEFDRSLHPKITRFLTNLFFKVNKERQAQLIVTTHDVTLLDVKLIRRDSIWFCRKDKEMSSLLYSLEEYTKVRNDKALQKAYLLGLYGAIPLVKEGIDAIEL